MSEDESQRIQAQARSESIRITLHAHQRMVEQDVSLADLLEALDGAQIIESYPEHRRGPCCLVLGQTAEHRPLHIVCTTSHPVLIVITVYEPRPPKWLTPTERGGRPDEV